MTQEAGEARRRRGAKRNGKYWNCKKFACPTNEKTYEESGPSGLQRSSNLRWTHKDRRNGVFTRQESRRIRRGLPLTKERTPIIEN